MDWLVGCLQIKMSDVVDGNRLIVCFCLSWPGGEELCSYLQMVVNKNEAAQQGGGAKINAENNKTKCEAAGFGQCVCFA